MSKNPEFNRYGYITQGNIPLLSNPDIKSESRERPGILKMLGEMALIVGATAVAGSIARAGTAKAMLSITDSAAPWKRALAEQYKEITGKLDLLEGITEEKMLGSRVSVLDYYRDYKDGLQARGGKGLAKYLPDTQYTKAALIQRGVAAGRRIPFELPGYYVTNRFVVNRDQYEKDVRSGKLDPKNPFDFIGDFAQKSVGYIVSDMALSFAGPYAADVKKTTINFAQKMPSDKLASSLSRFGTLQQAALSDNIAALAKFQERNLVKLEGASDIFKYYNQVKINRSIQTNESKDFAIDLSLGPIGKLKLRKQRFIAKDEFEHMGSLMTKRLDAYDKFGPGAMFQVGNNAPGQVLGSSFNRINQEFGILGEYFETRHATGSLNYGNHLLVNNISNKLINIAKTDLTGLSDIAPGLSKGQRSTVFNEALNFVQKDMLELGGKAKTGGPVQLARAATGSINIPASSSASDYLEQVVFTGWASAMGPKELLKKGSGLSEGLKQYGIKLSDQESSRVVGAAYDTVKSRVIGLAQNKGLYQIGDNLLDIGEEAVRATEKMAREGASSYLRQSSFKKIILSDSKTTQNQIAEAALGLFSRNTTALIGKGNAVDIWAKSLGTSTNDAIDLAKVILKKQGRAVDTFQQSFNILGLRRMSIEESVGYQRRYYDSLKSGVPLGKDQLSNAVSIYGRDVSYGVRGPGASLFVQTAGNQAKNIAAETGLYTTITGKVVDLRSTVDTALRTAQWVGQNMQVPILKMNPMEMVGADRILDRYTKPRIGITDAGTNRQLYQEMLSDSLTAGRAGEALAAPMLQVKKHGIGYSWPGQTAIDYGRFSFGENKSSMYQKLARLTFRETRLPGWSRTERGFQVNVGKSKFGFGVSTKEAGSDEIKDALRGKFHFTTPSGKRKILPIDFDVSEDTSGSLFHKLTGWINKQAYQKRNVLGKKVGQAVENENYAPNIINRILKEGQAIEAGSNEATNLKQIRDMLGSQMDEVAQATISQGYRGKQFATIGGEVFGDITEGLNFRGDAGDSFGVLAERMRIISASTKEAAGEKSLSRTLDSFTNKVDDLAAAAKIRRPTSVEEMKGRQLAQNFSMMVSLINGDDAIIKEMEERGLSLFQSRQINSGSYAAIKAQIASVKLYSSHAAAPPRGGAIGISEATDALESAMDALNLVLGPRGGMKPIKTGGRTLDLFNQYNQTIGNRSWLDPEAGIIEKGGAVSNIFGRNKENLIAVRPFGWKSGIARGLEDLKGRAAGSWGAEGVAEEDIAFGRSVKGALFGGGNKLGGDISTGTMIGWHTSNRVLSVFEMMGIGLSPHKYSSGMDLFVRGGFAKRALPIYGAVFGFGVAQGIPGLGTQGIGGLAASAAGPGLGGIRAGLGQALNPLPGAAFGSQEFWQTYADVTQSQEDDFARKMARTPEEESAYWQMGDAPVRQGRMWMLGNSPWKGGRISFYQPNWYRRYMSQYQYTDDFKGSHAEWAMFGSDISPGKFFDPYHYEKKHYETRPYPVSGDMFTGPWGPLTPMLNATVGAIIKPRRTMHDSPEEMSARNMISTYQTTNGPGAVQLFSSGMMKTGQLMSYPGASDEGQPFGFSMVGSGGGLSNISTSASAIGAMNRVYGIGSSKTGLGVVMANNVGVGLNSKFIQGGAREQYFRQVPTEANAQNKGLGYSIGELGYLTKEWAGIYGFAAGGLFEGLGFNKDFVPSQPVLESADRMYGSERSFWDLSIGGLGDLPMGKEGNLELSEVTRRFIPHRRKNITSINNIPNQMPDWMPGPGSLIDFRTGDPFCISRNTIVEIDDLQFISADKVTTKDKITTHRGNKVKVQQVSERSILPEESVYSLKISTLSGLTYEFSEEHPILIKDNNNTVFKKVKDLNKNDYVAYPIPKFEKEIVVVDMSEILPEYTFTENYIYICGSIDFAKSYEFIEMGNNKFLRGELKQYLDNNSINRKSFEAAQQSIKNNRVKRINRFIEIDSDIAYLIGIYIAEGWTGNGLVGLVHHITEKEYFNKAISGALKIDKNASYKISKEEDNYFYGHIYSKAVQKFLEYFVGKKSSEKIIPLFSSKLEKNILLNLLKGLFDGDGSIFLDNGKPRASLKTINKTIALQFRKLLLSYGYVFSIVKNNSGRQSIFGIDRLKSESYNVILRGKNAVDFAYDLNYISIKELFYTSEITNTYYDKDEEFIYLKVLSNNIIDTVDIVYGYEVNIDDSFCVAGFATHNTKIPKGEARLPGLGYERLNELHPDQYGQYGAIDRLKILANVMPWSNEYRYWSQIVSQNMNISDEQQAIVTEAKRQASQRKKKLNLRKKIWSGQIKQYDSTGMEMSGDDPNIFTTGSGETVRLAGIRFASSEVGMSQARDFYNSYLKDQKIELYKDMELDSPLNNRERTTDVIAKVNGINVNELLLKKIRRGELEGSESRTNNYIDMNLRVGGGWAAFGKAEEALSHLEVPFFKTKFGKYDAEEWLEQKMVYGKQWQPWEKPYESFLRPALDTFTKPNGIAGTATSTIFTGILASMFFRGSSAKKIAGTIGGVTGLMMNQQHNIESLLTGQRWVPERRKREAEAEEYMDVLKYVKYTKLYNDARQQAIEKEGIDVEQISDLMGNIKEEAKYRQRTAWEEAPVGAKPSRATSNKILESIGPLANQALMYKNKAQATMYGAPLVGDYMATMSAVPKRYKSIFQQLSEAPKSRREDILELLPRGMRRILQAQWGMPIEERPDLDKYFRSHSLPGKNWEGWLPQVNLDEVTIKVIKNEGLDTAEFGYYENEVKNAELMPWATPSIGNDGRSSHDIMTQLSQMGFSDITIRESPLPGIHMNLSLDMTKEIMNSLGY
jgi:hypothetical protein